MPGSSRNSAVISEGSQPFDVNQAVEALEHQQRLAQFLDETAAAMEGGKSLSMVHPETEMSDHHKTLAELAAAAEASQHPRPELARAESASSGVTASTLRHVRARPGFSNSRLSSYDTYRDTIFFTPEPVEELQTEYPGLTAPAARASLARPSLRPVEFVKEEEDEDGLMTLAAALMDDSEGPATHSDSDDDEVVREKLLDKRRRTICELIETEALYAADMAVIRHIYLARARGFGIDAIADHVMASGLGLATVVTEAPPTPDPSSPDIARRPSLLMPQSSEVLLAEDARGESLLSSKDIHVIFSNIEGISDFALAFSGVLDHAWTRGAADGMDDCIGRAFIEMLPRIQSLYSRYCSHHHRAIMRLQELEPTLSSCYLSECRALSHGRTKAWDLASLLIKPVQRCLKYPLLLQQILACTPDEHPDRADLEIAHQRMLAVAEHINEVKKRTDLVGRIVSKDGAHRRESSGGGSFGRTMTKKLLRTGQKAKHIVGLGQAEKDAVFNQLSALVESTRSSVVRFTSEMSDWAKNTKMALDAQAMMVQGFVDVYEPMSGEIHVAGGGYERLCVFLSTVLEPLMKGPYRDLERTIQRSLLVKTEHLLSLFENPLSVIAKRNTKSLDHSRYVSKKVPADRRGSEEFLALSAQLLDELPKFLGNVSRYFEIILAGFAAAQAAYHQEVKNYWEPFAAQWFTQIPEGDYQEIEDAFEREHQPVAQIMDTLAAGLGIAAASHAHSPARSRRPSVDSSSSYFSNGHRSSGRHRSQHSTASREWMGEYQSPTATDRSSQFSNTSSTPSWSQPFTTPPAPTTPPPFPSRIPSKAAFDQASTARASSFSPVVRAPPMLSVAEVTRAVSRLSMYIEDNFVEAAEEMEEVEEEPDTSPSAVLYVAEAVTGSRSSDVVRAGFPVLSFEVGDYLHVESEEADVSTEGGAGWIFGFKQDGEYGWGRSEDFVQRD